MTTRSKTKKAIEDQESDDKAQDKENLLRALVDHGQGVLYDFELLKSYLPNKSLGELKFLIDSYEKKGKELSLKQNYLDRYTEMKNIVNWSSVISNCIPFPAKKDDFARVLLDIFIQFTEDRMNANYDDENDENGRDDEDEEQDEEESGSGSNNDETMKAIEGGSPREDDEEKIDYNAIYSYFNEILNSRFASTLPDKEAAIAYSMMNNINEMVELLGNDSEKAFLLAESWWKPIPAITNDITNGTTNGTTNDTTSDTTNGTTNGTIDETANGTTNSQTNTPENPLPNSNVAADENARERPEFYEDLPRFRKIRECLNPLKIPSIILNDNHDLLSSFML